MKKSIYVVILAGGSGTRFWPLSRQDRPKQFLNMLGSRSLFQQTLERIIPLVPTENVFIAANKQYHRVIQRQARIFKIPAKNILLEVAARNTAPAIAWAAARIAARDKNGVMVVLPSDHLILQPKKFLNLLKQAISLAQHGHLLTLGIVPTRPETGYGYLQIKSQQAHGGKIWRVVRFTEKPSLAKAKKIVRSGKYLWNSGMFIWRADVILAEFKKYLPAIYKQFSKRSDDQHTHKVWKSLPRISIDYGILEKARDVLTVPAQGIGWSDLGSWEALAEVLLKKGNVLRGQVLAEGCRNTLVLGNKKLIATIGLNDVVVVDTDDALLICRQDRSQEVKKIVDHLKARKLFSYL